MLKVGIARVRPEKEERLRAWFAELMRRPDEVRETFVQETMRHEVAYILPGADGPVLVYAMEAEDHDHARQAVRASTLPIDLEHRAVMKECLDGPVGGDPVYECTV